MAHTDNLAVRRAAAFTLATAVLDLVVLALFHIVQPDVDVMSSPTSDYVHGTLGVLSQVAACAVGLGALALAFAALRATSPSGRSRTGVVLLAVFGLAKVAQAFFPIDAEGAATTSGELHNLFGNVAFFALPFAVVLLTPLLASRATRGVTLLVTWAPVVATALVLAGEPLGAFGLLQRLYLVVAALWFAVVALWLLRAPRD